MCDYTGCTLYILLLGKFAKGVEEMSVGKLTQVSISGLAPHADEGDGGDRREKKTQVKLSCTGQIQITQVILYEYYTHTCSPVSHLMCACDRTMGGRSNSIHGWRYIHVQA